MRSTSSILLKIKLLLALLVLTHSNIFAQCNNADFSSGDFTGWTGSYAGGTAGFDAAANDAVPSTNKPHCLITAAGFDATVGTTLLPVIPPGATKSMRLGNAVGNSAKESISYSFTVNANNTNFTYQYAVVLDGSSPHSAAEQPYFKISMTDGSGASIACGTYDVNSTSSASIGGFDSVTTGGTVIFGVPTGGAKVKYKVWSSVTIPLYNYIGQTVKVTFETRDCSPAGVGAGSHWAYAYISANCSPLEILKSAPSVCPGQTVTLTAPAAKAYSWKGPSPGAIVSGATGSVATVNAPGTYTVTLTAFGSAGCTYDLTADMVPFLPGSGVLVNSATICTGGTVVLTASGGAPYSWSTGATTTSITVTPASTTTYSVSGGTCPSTNVGTVTVNSTPTSTFTGTTVCANEGSAITYTGDGDANSTYTWNFDSGIATPASGMGPFSVSWPSGGTKNVTLTVANGPCTSSLTTNPVTVNIAPTLTITESTICNGASGTVTAAGAASYSWSEGTLVATLTDSPVVTTTYTVVGTSSGCSATSVGTITVNQLQDATFSYTPATVCKTGGTNPTPVISGITGGTFASATNDANLNMNASGVIDLALTPVGTYTIRYTTPGPCQSSSDFVINIVSIPVADFTLGTYCQNVTNPFPAYSNQGSAGAFTSTAGLVFVSPVTIPGEIDLMASTAGTYTVTNTIAAGGGCPSAMDTALIIINAIPNTTVNSPTACSGAPAIMNASGAASYSWSEGSLTNSVSVTPVSTTIYTVTGNTAGCTSVATSTVTVNTNPTVTVQSKTICEGTTTAVYASGAATYVWSDNSILDSLVVSAPTANVAYTVVGTTSGCTGTASGNVTVNALPVVTVDAPAICQGLSGNVTAAGANTYIWIAPGNVFYIGNPYNVTPTAATSYTVIGTTANCNGMPVGTQAEQNAFRTCFSGGCAAQAVSNVTQVLKPVINVLPKTICLGASATLTATGGAQWAWTASSGPPPSPTQTIIVFPTVTSTYTVTDATPGCQGSTTTTVTVNPLPIVGAASQTICNGLSTNLTATGAVTYSWTGGAANGSASNPLPVSPVATTSYTVIGTDINTCKDTAVTSVTVNALPNVTVTGTSVCEGVNASVTAAGASTYSWSNGSANNPFTSSTLAPGTTLMTVIGTDANGCKNSAVSTIVIYAKPVAQFNASPQPAGILEPTITFIDQSSIGVNYWKWDFGDGETLAPSTSNPVHTYPAKETTYTVTLTVNNPGLCPDSITHEIIIGPEFSFYMPNSFSPNGDGINETFFGKGGGILDYQLTIYDRWGNFIFYADDIDKGWNGIVKGGTEVAQQDTYVWKVALTDIFKKKHSYIGTVSILLGK